MDDEEDEVVNEVELASLLYPKMSTMPAWEALLYEKWRRAFHDEFWSDPCWSE